jgi:hypothetical protein
MLWVQTKLTPEFAERKKKNRRNTGQSYVATKSKEVRVRAMKQLRTAD